MAPAGALARCAGGLEALRGQLVTAALSNGHVALLVDLARYGDLRFDCVLSAEMVHAYKPVREVYRSAARFLGVQPAELMLVAAHPGDLEGARRAGLRTAFIDRPLEYGPNSPGREDPDADESVEQLHELAARLALMSGRPAPHDRRPVRTRITAERAARQRRSW